MDVLKQLGAWMAISFQSQPLHEFSFLRGQVRECVEDGGLAKEILTLQLERSAQGSKRGIGARLCEFFHGGSNRLPYYLPIDFSERKEPSANPSKDPFEGLEAPSEHAPREHPRPLAEWLVMAKRGHGTLAVVGAGGTGKSAAAVEFFVRTILQPQDSRPDLPSLACWLVDAPRPGFFQDGTWQEFAELISVAASVRNAPEGPQNIVEVLRNSPPILFFLDLDRFGGADDRVLAANAVADFVSRKRLRAANGDRHVLVVLARSSADGHDDPIRVIQRVLPATSCVEPLPIKKDDAEQYLENRCGPRVGEERFLKLDKMIGGASLLTNPLHLTSLAEMTDAEFGQLETSGDVYDLLAKQWMRRGGCTRADGSLDDVGILVHLMMIRVGTWMITNRADSCSFEKLEQIIVKPEKACVVPRDHVLARTAAGLTTNDDLVLSQMKLLENKRELFVDRFKKFAVGRTHGGHWRFLHDSFRDFYAGRSVAESDNWEFTAMELIEASAHRWAPVLRLLPNSSLPPLTRDSLISFQHAIEELVSANPWARVATGPLLLFELGRREKWDANRFSASRWCLARRNLAIAHLRTDDAMEARTLVKETLELLMASDLDTNSERLFWSRVLLLSVATASAADLGDRDDFEVQAKREIGLIRRYLATLRTLDDQDHIQRRKRGLSIIWNNLGTAFAKLGMLRRAARSFERALHLVQDGLVPEGREDFVTLLSNICQNFGSLHRNLGETDRAESYYSKVLTFLHRRFPDGGPPDVQELCWRVIIGQIRIASDRDQWARTIELSDDAISWLRQMVFERDRLDYAKDFADILGYRSASCECLEKFTAAIETLSTDLQGLTSVVLSGRMNKLVRTVLGLHWRRFRLQRELGLSVEANATCKTLLEFLPKLQALSPDDYELLIKLASFMRRGLELPSEVKFPDDWPISLIGDSSSTI